MYGFILQGNRDGDEDGEDVVVDSFQRGVRCSVESHERSHRQSLESFVVGIVRWNGKTYSRKFRIPRAFFPIVNFPMDKNI